MPEHDGWLPRNLVMGRTNPYVLRGRDYEFYTIARYFHSLPTSISVIHGSPGVGKSCMLRGLEQYAHNHGILPIPIVPKHLTSMRSLQDRIIEVTSTDPVVVDSYSNTAGVKAFADFLGISVGGGGATSQIIRPVVGFDTIIRFLTEISPSGVVFTMDECQALDEIAVPEHREHAGMLLLEFHNTQVGNSVGLPVVLICAGLSNTISVLHKFGISRFDDYHVVKLRAFNYETGQLVLHDFLDIQPPDDKAMNTIPQSWIDSLTRLYCASPYHLNLAGLYLQKAALEDEGEFANITLDHICNQVNRRCREAFSFQFRRLSNVGRYCLLELGQAAKVVHNRFPDGTILELIEAIREKYRVVRAGVTVADTEQIYEEITRVGVLDYHSVDEDCPTLVRDAEPRSYEEIVTAQLVDWLAEKRELLAESTKSGTARTLLNYDFIGEIEGVLGSIENYRALPPWQFGVLGDVPELPEMPYPEYVRPEYHQAYILPNTDTFGRPIFVFPDDYDDDDTRESSSD